MAWGQGNADGQGSVLHRPRWTVVGGVLLKQGAVFELLLLPPLAVAVLGRETALAVALAAPALLIAAAIVLARRVELPDDIRRIEAVLSLVAVFALAIALTAPAYLTLGLTPVDAAFEATSALTTTGFSMIADPGELPLAAHVLRAWSQWCGGLVIAVAGLALLMDRGPAAKALGLADFGDAEMASSVRSYAQALLLAYLGFTLVGMAGAALLIPGLPDGPLLALAAISTGGMAPRADSLASYPAAAQTFLVLLATLGALSLAVPVLAWRKGLLATLRSPAVLSFLRVFGASLALTTLVLLLSGTATPASLRTSLLNLLSLQSTTGFTVAPVDGTVPFLVLLIAFMAIGGQIGSTSGGIKLDRLRILLRAVGVTFQRLLSPASAVLRIRLDGEVVPDDRLAFVVALATTYILSAFALWIAFTLYGYPPGPALFDIVSALSTVGAGVGVIGPDLPDGLKLLTILAMLLGRVEFFGILVLALPQTWLRRD